MNRIPSSVYKLLLSKKFPLKKATQLVPYLYNLGIEGICCSPIFEAFSHGYDITNPNRLNPVLGTQEDFEEFISQLQKLGMKHILDIVPNHMGIKGDKNLWWIDVLEKGPTSPFAEFFDINWTPDKEQLKGKILLPILNGPYGRVLEKGEIELIWKDGFWVQYFEYLLPVCFATYPQIFEAFSPTVSTSKKNKWLECLVLAKTGTKEQVAAHYRACAFIQHQVSELLLYFNKKPDILHNLLEKQFYRLSYWVASGQEINYRRFFNINELAAIRIEKEKVLRAHHRWVFDLIETDKVQGLRIDHPDGLYDPSQYFERLREKNPAFIWVEKILDFGEVLPEKWEIDGTVGYEFLNILSGLFVQKKHEQRLTDIYEEFVKDKITPKQIQYERRKKYILLQMSSEINFLGMLLDDISEKNRYYRDFTKADLTKACLEIIACFPVYRTYIKPGIEIRKKDREYVLYAVETAKIKAPEIDSSVFDYIKNLLLLAYESSPEEKDLAIDFLLRFQQLTAPVMAKGLEDSTFYIYNRLISLNEVGGNPSHFGASKSEFHAFNQQKLKNWPLGALASSTHDTKYSENARLRIHALSEIPDQWEALVFTWKKQNQKFKTKVNGVFFPDPNLEYLIYQMLIALWPTDPERIWKCVNKAMREAGIYTSWHKVNEKYESAVKNFFDKILKPSKSNLFYPSFLLFQKEVSGYGFWNSLSALIIKIGSCGIVDIFQGDEIMNYSLMDPDNRRSLDFGSFKKKLKSGNDLKMKITALGLTFRKNHKELFLLGEYVPLKSPENIVAFMRQWKNQKVLILAKRYFSQSNREGHLKLPKNFKTKTLQNIFTDQKIIVHKNAIHFDEAFEEHPFAILTGLKND